MKYIYIQEVDPGDVTLCINILKGHSCWAIVYAHTYMEASFRESSCN